MRWHLFRSARRRLNRSQSASGRIVSVVPRNEILHMTRDLRPDESWTEALRMGLTLRVMDAGFPIAYIRRECSAGRVSCVFSQDGTLGIERDWESDGLRFWWVPTE